MPGGWELPAGYKHNSWTVDEDYWLHRPASIEECETLVKPIGHNSFHEGGEIFVRTTEQADNVDRGIPV